MVNARRAVPSSVVWRSLVCPDPIIELDRLRVPLVDVPLYGGTILGYRDARHVTKQRQTDLDAAIALLDIDVRDP